MKTLLEPSVEDPVQEYVAPQIELMDDEETPVHMAYDPGGGCSAKSGMGMCKHTWW